MAHPSLWLYRVLLHALLPAVLPAMAIRDRLVGKQRPGLGERMARHLPVMPVGGLWLQAVSVGEVELARRLVTELDRRVGSPPLVLTATTATGLALARRTLGSRLPVFACPVDLPRPVSRILNAARPRALVLIETELWPEMLHQAGRREVPVAVVNARLSESSFDRYRRLRWVLEPLLRPLQSVLARALSDAERFAALGVPEKRIQVLGNIKYDLEPDPAPLPWAAAVRQQAAGRPVVVAGSTMEDEEDLVLDALAELRSQGLATLTILAPRHPERFDLVARGLAGRGLTVARRSQLADNPGPLDVLLLDTIGELGRAYGLAQTAFIGGSLVATGGHNPLEPAVWGVPTVTGPHVFNFQEIYDELTAAGGAVIVADRDGLVRALGSWLRDPATAAMAGESGRNVVASNRGATSRTVDALLAMADGPAA